MPRENTTQTTPFDLLMQQLSDVAQETKSHGKLLAGMSIRLEDLARKSDQIEQTVKDVANAEFSCPARIHDEHTQKRISKLEALRNLDQTGEISVIRQIPQPKEDENDRVYSTLVKFFVKKWPSILPWVLLGLLGLAKGAQEIGIIGDSVKLPTVEQTVKQVKE